MPEARTSNLQHSLQNLRYNIDHVKHKVAEELRPNHRTLSVGWITENGNGYAFVAPLRACTKNKDLCMGSKLHNDILRRGLLEKCLDELVTMYAKCGALSRAKELFDIYMSRSVLTWTALIAGCIQRGQCHHALDYFEWMKKEGLFPDSVTYTCVLKACADIRALGKGEKIHDEVAKQGLLENNVVVGNALVDMYVKCGALAKARRALEGLLLRNVISWTALIVGYVEHGQVEQALKCLELMQQEGIPPNAITLLCILKACGNTGAIEKGEEIHDEITKQGWLMDNNALGTALIDMYSKCGALAKAHQVLWELPVRNAISWTALILGYVELGEGEQALSCFVQMQAEGLSPDAVTFACVLKACGSLGAIDKGGEIHNEIHQQGLLQDNAVLATSLVDMYAKCGALAKARQVLEELPARSVVSWNVLLAAYVEYGQGVDVLNSFKQMQREGLLPDAVTLACVLQACGILGAADEGQKIHDEIAKKGFLGNDMVLGNALVDMYAKCGALAKAQRVLGELPVRNVISWTALITGYTDCGEAEKALGCFEQMQREGLSPNGVTLLCALKSCGSMGADLKGEKIHNEVVKLGLFGNDVVVDTALVDMYAKCGSLVKARAVLEEMPERNVISWNALLAGYAEHGEGAQALNCFAQMQCEALSPDAGTYACILKACGSTGAVEKGEELHSEIAKQGLLKDDIVLATMLVDMYAKCGALMKARQLLEELPTRDVISWTALIARYAEHGKAEQAFNCFEQMQHEGLSPNGATFSSMLTACSGIDLLAIAQACCMNMSSQYGVRPNADHYTCLVGLYGRAGQLHEAVALIEKMPASTSMVWSTLLGACQRCGDVEVGSWAFECAIMSRRGLSWPLDGIFL